MTRQYAFSLPHREAMAADDFMVAACNREAVAWLDSWPGWPAPALTLYGPAGCGKTHLVQVWLAKSGGVALAGSALARGEIPRAARAVALDDAETVAGDDAAEEALFHLYNALREDKGALLLTAGDAPAKWNIRLPDLRSRLVAAPAVAIEAPNDELLSALLVKQFRDRQIEIGIEVVGFILARLERTAAAVRGIAEALDRASLAEGRKITIPLARRVMETVS